MCGIVGCITAKTIEKKMLISMRDAMYHRGPDAGGVYVDTVKGTNIGLAHRRLAIVDISERGEQPMISPDGTCVITYNGEIYNHAEIRQELQKLGHVFTSTCDTEVVLHAYMQWGIDAVKKFNGMFAYAIFDKRCEKLYLVRDRLGKKPLYYYRSNHGFLFASELAALVQCPWFERKINEDVLRAYLWRMSVQAPYSIFENTYKLRAGTILTYDICTGEVQQKEYWNLDWFYRKYSVLPENELLAELERLLMDAVKRRLVADVPVGVFLSGGIDSSLIASLAQTVSDVPVNTFSIGFEEAGKDEALYSKEIAKSLGTKHHEKYCTIKEAMKYVQKIPKAFSEPFADNSQIPMMMLSEFAKEHVTVTLSGDGGDELFFGYPTDRTIPARNRRYASLARVIRKIPDVGLLKDIYCASYWKKAKTGEMGKAYYDFTSDVVIAQRLIDPLFIKPSDITEKYINWQMSMVQNEGTVEEKILNLETKDGLQEDMLVKVDRATMAYSLEARAPFLDYRVVELSSSIPIDLKCKNGVYKAPLRTILYKYVPKELLDRPKNGFGVPINEWLHKDFRNLVGDYLSPEFIAKQGIFDKRAVSKLYEAFIEYKTPALDRIVWCLLMFQMWWEENGR